MTLIEWACKWKHDIKSNLCGTAVAQFLNILENQDVLDNQELSDFWEDKLTSALSDVEHGVGTAEQASCLRYMRLLFPAKEVPKTKGQKLFEKSLKVKDKLLGYKAPVNSATKWDAQSNFDKAYWEALAEGDDNG